MFQHHTQSTVHRIRRRALVLGTMAALVGCAVGDATEGEDVPPEDVVAADATALDPNATTLRAASDKVVGTALHASHLGDATYMSLGKTQFDLVTPEGETTWRSLHIRDEATYNFAPAHRLIDAVKAGNAGVKFKGAHLLWAGDANWPAWLKTFAADPATTKAQLEKTLLDHIRAVVTELEADIGSWNVANEFIVAKNNGGQQAWNNCTASNGRVAFRPDAVYTKLASEGAGDDGMISLLVDAFHAVQQINPSIRRIYNDFDGEAYAPKATCILNLVKRINQVAATRYPTVFDTAGRKAVQEVGLQAHVSIDPTSYQNLNAFIDQIVSAGLDFNISELDVWLFSNAPARLTAQNAIYERVARACKCNARCRSFSVWGVTDRYWWLGAEHYGLPWSWNGSTTAPVYAKKGAWTSIRTGLTAACP